MVKYWAETEHGRHGVFTPRTEGGNFHKKILGTCLKTGDRMAIFPLRLEARPGPTRPMASQK
jgi:hypothetical protein